MDDIDESVKRDSEKEGIIMTINICPEDGTECTMTEEEKKGQGCWFCPKIQEMLGGGDDGKERSGEEER